ncbi:MAG: hypothetical protein KA384_08235 [Leptotrichiaceae bacterium]|nr:hypothetical protein [Leptotrichiaceae bacterium]
MKKIILLFSHKLTDSQIKDIKRKLQCKEILYLPEKIQSIFSNVTSDNREFVINELKVYLSKNADKGDYILIQGEFGVSYKMINYSKEIGLIPVYSSTKRETIEINKGNKIKKITFFKHEEFVEY